jgi:hypothetical protein
VFNDWEYGSYFILAQKHRIYIDTRNIIYSRESFNEYLNIVNGVTNWESSLEKYKFKYIVVNKKTSSKLITLISMSKKWDELKEESDAVLFVKK